MSAKISSIAKDLYDRVLQSRRITALTGGLRSVGDVVITNSGSGYTSAPTVAFTGGGGTGAAATATVTNGVVSSITITNVGSGYTSTPTIGFSGGGGSGAAATAIMAATTLDAIPTTTISAGEITITIPISSVAYVYQLQAGTTAESSPSVIRPDDYNASTNAKVWVLQSSYISGQTILDGTNIVLGTTTGTKIGTATNQKLAFFNSTPIVQPGSTTDLRVALINLGLLASGGATPLDLNGGALTSATHTLTDGSNIVVGSTTGTKIGTATTQKIGFFNATPIVQPANTTDLRTALINLGLLATGGATPLDLNGGALTNGNQTFTDGSNMIVGSTTGTKIGTATTQKLAFFNSTPIVQPNNTTDLRVALINLGLLASGGATPLDLNGGALTNGNQTFTDGSNMIVGSTTGTKLGTATTQKLGFWNATPIVQPSGAEQAAPAAYVTGAFGLDSDANMHAFYDLVVAMRTALVNAGIMKGAA